MLKAVQRCKLNICLDEFWRKFLLDSGKYNKTANILYIDIRGIQQNTIVTLLTIHITMC